MQMTLTSDELVLALISLVRATNPGMLRQDKDGFSLDLGSLAEGAALNDDQRLLLKVHAALEQPAANNSVALDLAAWERRRLAETLERLESLQSWPADVRAMSASLRTRLVAGE